jgi:hypothetical protein
MAKETKKRTMKPDLPYFEPDTRTDEEREAARLEARVQLAAIRKHCNIKPGKPRVMQSIVQQALTKPTPNVYSVRLPDPVRKAGDLCRCGLKLIPVDWSMNGVENPPPICPKCRDLSAQCTCEGELF